jgi:hypothetical protein
MFLRTCIFFPVSLVDVPLYIPIAMCENSSYSSVLQMVKNFIFDIGSTM